MCQDIADKAMQLVEVIWVDAMIEESHLPLEAITNMVPIERRNQGYLVESTDTCIKVTFGILKNIYKNEVGYDKALIIPRCMIKAVNKLKRD